MLYLYILYKVSYNYFNISLFVVEKFDQEYHHKYCNHNFFTNSLIPKAPTETAKPPRKVGGLDMSSSATKTPPQGGSRRKGSACRLDVEIFVGMGWLAEKIERNSVPSLKNYHGPWKVGGWKIILSFLGPRPILRGEV